MDDGDLDFSNPETYLCSSLGTDAPGGCSMDSYFDDILKDTEHLACTHTHTCNPPAHDLSHTHTCVHVHTKVVSASSDGAESPSAAEGAASKKRRPSGNRAAVRKYREKKKAHTALLEEEVVHLKALNKQLMRKVQSHAALEAEVARLRCLLVDIRGRIEGEIGSFPYGRPVPKSAVDLVPGGGVDAAQVMSSCDFRCNDQLYCNPGMQMRTMGDDAAMGGQVFRQGTGDFPNVQCIGNAKSGSTMPPSCGGSMPSGCLPNSEQR
uniref:Uncharacterized protein n=1 Tax=Avena sativa TaxID=4498 RepID=A0ACD5ZE50_AVESA